MNAARTGLACAVLLAGACAVEEQGDGLNERIEAAQARVAAIDARAGRVDDINTIENLQRSYGYYVDKMLWEHVLDLFADDATLEIGFSGVYVGKERIREYLFSLSGGTEGPLEGVLYNHMQLQPIVTLAADRESATARWRALILTGVSGSGSGGNWGEGPYENEYVKQDGVWKISKLQLYPTFIAPYEEGWLNADADAVRSYSEAADVNPDQPTSTDYAPFPAAFTPPFSFTHPVTGAPSDPTTEESSADAVDPEPAIANVEQAVAEAKLRLRKLSAYDEIENLAGVYGHYVDKSMQDDIADLFTPDGVVEILGRGVYYGQDRVREYMHNLGPVGPQPGALFNHMHIQPVIHVADDGQSARVRSRLVVMFSILDANAQWGAGVYENEVVLEDGVWKFDYLHAYQTFYTNYEDGWANQASAIFAPYDRLPPDGPQSVPYDPYPAAFVPPFHYVNPVSGRDDYFGQPRPPARP